MHWHQPARAQFFKHSDRLVRPHMQMSKRVGVVSPDWQQGDLRLAGLADLLETVEISAVARVINPPALVFEDKAAVAAMAIPQDARPPVLRGCQRHAPIPL